MSRSPYSLTEVTLNASVLQDAAELLKESVCLFAPAASVAFGAAVSACLDLPLGAIEERVFDGGEQVLRPVDDVRGRSVHVVQSLFSDALGSANDRLCALLFLIGALKDAGAKRVTACVPYLAYARQDRHTEAHDPVTSRYVAQLFEAVGVDRVAVLEVHNPAAFDNAFRCETMHVDAAPLFVEHYASDAVYHKYAVVTPDIGGAKRARHCQTMLQSALGRPVNFAFMDKQRIHGMVSGTLFAGDVAGRRVIVLDDLISSGATVRRAVDACRRAGAVRVDVAATHVCFAPEGARLFDVAPPAADRPDALVVTDSVAIRPGLLPSSGGSPTVLSAASCFAEAIRRLEQGCR